MIKFKKHWHIRLKSGKSYHCRHLNINLGFYMLTISVIFLGLKKFDLRINWHTTNW